MGHEGVLSHSGEFGFLDVAPRFAVGDADAAVAFHETLGFRVTHRDGGFLIVERDGVCLHLNSFTDGPEAARRCSVCWIDVRGIDSLYARCVSANAVSHPLESKAWGFRQFAVADPSGNLILFAERIPTPL